MTMTVPYSALPSRRRFLAGAASVLALTAAGCTTGARQTTAPSAPPPPPVPERVRQMYAATYDGGHFIPAVDMSQIDPKFWRQRVDYPTNEPVGTLVVDTPNRFLYLIESAGQALRYGVGIGRAGFAWSGRAHIAYKRAWPTWTPPAEMIARQPELEQWRHGQPGGLDNPLGARALYIHQGGRDTLYRVHGTNEPWSIGQAVSSGCVRLLNQDVIDLADRVRNGAAITVIQAPELENPTGPIPQTVQEALDPRFQSMFGPE